MTQRKVWKWLVFALVLVVVLAVELIYVTVPGVIKQAHQGRLNTCLNNQKQLITALQMYIQDNDGNLPQGDYWGNLCMDRGVVQCPEKAKWRECYGFNNALSKAKIPLVLNPAQTVVSVESDAPHNLVRTPADIVARHAGKCTVSYLDGHVAAVAPGAVDLAVKVKKEGK